MSRKAKSLPLKRKDVRAYIEDGAEIGDAAQIGPFTYLFSGSRIGRNSVIGSHCIIGHPSKKESQGTDFSATSPEVAQFLVKEPFTRIGEGSIVRAGSMIYNHVKIGKRLHTGHSILIREQVTIGDDCVIGTKAVLDGYIKVGNKSMIQSLCYITQSVKIGNGVFIAPGCLFFDNKRIVLGEGLSGITVGDYVRIGGGTKILPGVSIGRCSLIGAGSVITKDVPPKAIAYGVPAKVQGFQENEEIHEYMDSIKRWQ